MPRPLHLQGLVALLTAALCFGIAHAQDTSNASESESTATESDDGDADDKEDKKEDSVTHHTMTIAGSALAYTATAGTVTLEEENGTEKADVFFIAYTKDDVPDQSTRPITFCFNGGPGSSSVWLHLGAFGPKRVDMGDAGSLKAPPWQLLPNEETLLDLTDMVFIDPVTTGYSRARDGEDASQFHGVEEDIEAVAEFIRLYTTRNLRWKSPKFLAGESYGTTRAGGLAQHLQSRHGMYLNGIILVSSILNFQTTRFASGNDQPYVLFLPTLTATAWYHGRLAPPMQNDLRRTLDEVERFALDDYARALSHGSTLDAGESRRIAERLAEFTGLSIEFIEQSNLRISMSRFTKSLLRDQRRTVGRLDSRFLGIDGDAAGERFEYDPSYAAIQGPYTAMLNHYVRSDLQYENDLTYEILTGRVHPWNYGSARNRYLNVAERLRRAMNQNRELRVFIASGYYDLATPYFATDYTFTHLGLEPELRNHVTTHYYESGHMMYIHEASRLKLKRDLEGFFDAAVSRP